MKIGVITDKLMKEELLAQGLAATADIVWMDKSAISEDVHHYIDLLYNPDEKINYVFNHYKQGVVIVNDVSNTLKDQPENFVRVNGWPTFLKRPLIEAACQNKSIKEITENIFAGFNKKTAWGEDKPGFISARVVSMIINEAYLSLEENVSTKNEIDIAMKLGTNYPLGPFEWSEKIGLKNIFELLTRLAKENPRYQPSEQLKKEIQP